MPYEAIAELVLASQEVGIPPSVSSFRNRLLSPAIAFFSAENCGKLIVEDRGQHLDQVMTPAIHKILPQDMRDWSIIMTGQAQYIEIKERWFFDSYAAQLKKRFAGIKVIMNDKQLDIEVDDDVIGALSVNLIITGSK
jgi:hypothetical protein